MRMMLDVIGAKAHRGRERVRQIGENRVQLVERRAFEHRVVDRIVDDHEHGVVGESADGIGAQQRKPPIQSAEPA